jgi:dolichol-phosphate mannosyltransferase
VRNVPAWRLSLSKSASALYRFLLHQKLGTYTSCFRVYRRSAVLDLELQRGGFLGIAEMIGKLDLAGFRVVEYPTTLNVRVLGYSKMKVVPTILGHLSVMLQLLGLRLFGARRLRASLRSRSDAAGVEAR